MPTIKPISTFLFFFFNSLVEIEIKHSPHTCMLRNLCEGLCRQDHDDCFWTEPFSLTEHSVVSKYPHWGFRLCVYWLHHITVTLQCTCNGTLSTVIAGLLCPFCFLTMKHVKCVVSFFTFSVLFCFFSIYSKSPGELYYITLCYVTLHYVTLY